MDSSASISECQIPCATRLNHLGKTDVLLLDDWGLAKLSAEQRRDLLEILEDRAHAQPLLPANYRLINGMPTLATQHWPMLLWIA
jgi:DNA replication protein DnaC